MMSFMLIGSYSLSSDKNRSVVFRRTEALST